MLGPVNPSSPPVVECTAADLRQRIEDGKTVVVDVREPNEWLAGVVPGALRIPLGQLAARLEEIPSGRPVVAVCKSGIRSRSAAQILKAAGFSETASLAGGMMGWQGAGHPVER